MNPEFDKTLKKAGVNPNLYNQQPPRLPTSNQSSKPRRRFGGKGVMGKPQIMPAPLHVGPLEEADTAGARIIALQSREVDDGLKLIYNWTRTHAIDYSEFEDLMAELTSKLFKKIR